MAGRALQEAVEAAQAIARKHGVSLSNVATRWVLQQNAVAAVIVGARLGESEHRADNLKVFDFSLTQKIVRIWRRRFPPPGACPATAATNTASLLSSPHPEI